MPLSDALKRCRAREVLSGLLARLPAKKEAS